MGDLFLVPPDFVEAKLDGRGLVVRFITPSSRNAISNKVIESLESIVDECERTRAIEQVTFIGSGGAFAAGANLQEIADLAPENARSFAIRGQTLMNRIAGLECRTAAVINGFCFGGGLDLALACGARIAGSDATFCHPGAGLGIITGWGGTQRLPRLVGSANALEMFFTASPIDAERALEIGLIDAIDDELIRAFHDL